MRRGAIAVVVLVSLALLTTAALAAENISTRKATLRIAALASMKVTGASFKAQERVRVTVSANGVKRAKQIRASRSGSFAVTFAEVEAVDRCNSDVWARATGARGSTATAKMPQAMCPPRLGNPAP